MILWWARDGIEPPPPAFSGPLSTIDPVKVAEKRHTRGSLAHSYPHTGLGRHSLKRLEIGLTEEPGRAPGPQGHYDLISLAIGWAMHVPAQILGLCGLAAMSFEFCNRDSGFLAFLLPSRIDRGICELLGIYLEGLRNEPFGSRGGVFRRTWVKN